jgi:hypothetical protein
VIEAASIATSPLKAGSKKLEAGNREQLRFHVVRIFVLPPGDRGQPFDLLIDFFGLAILGLRPILIRVIEATSVATSPFGEDFLEARCLGLTLTDQVVELLQVELGGLRAEMAGLRLEGGAAGLEFELLAAAVEEDEETAGGARGHGAVGGGVHDVVEEVVKGLGFGLGDVAAEQTPFAAGAELDFSFLGEFARLGGVAEAEGCRGVVAAEILVAVGGALTAAAVVETEGADAKHEDLQTKECGQ